MKFDPRLPPMPSIGEILEHPRIKGAVQRINSSTLAQRAGALLEEFRGSLAARAGRVELPTVTQLAERLARRLLGEPGPAGPVINATGLIFGDAELRPPLSERALHAMFQIGAEFHRPTSAGARAVERNLCDLAMAEAAFVTHSFDAALTLTLAATAGKREVAVIGDLDAAPIDWRRLGVLAGTIVRAVADRNLAASNDGHGAASARFDGVSAIVRPPGGESRDEDPVQSGAALAVLAQITRDRRACLIDAAPLAGTLNPSGYGLQPVETIRERLAAGADVVIVDGSGLLAGPSCGLILGLHQLVEAVRNEPLAPLLAADPITVAALSETIECYREDASAPVIYQLPVWQLLTAPLANLEQRAARLASLMAEATAIAGAEPRRVDSPWRRWASHEWRAPSWAIALRPKTGSAQELAARLYEGSNPIAGRVSDEAVLLDLRSVFPRWDQQLAAAVAALEP